MKAIVLAAMTLAVLVCSQRTLAQEKQPFADMTAAMDESVNHERRSAVFNTERRRLGEAFEKHLLQWVSDDPDRHYWSAAYLTEKTYLDGQTPRPRLALLILQQGLAQLAARKTDLDTRAHIVSLSYLAAVQGRQQGLTSLARSHKKRAETLLAAEEVLAGTVPAMDQAERNIYDSIRIDGADAHPKSLQQLIDGAKDGQTIRVPKGRYLSAAGTTIKERRNLTIICEPGTEILARDVNTDVLTIIGSSGIRIEGALLRHVKPLKEYECHGAVVSVQKSDQVQVVQCDVNGCGAIGVRVAGSKKVLIQNCWIHANTFTALYVNESDGVKITDNLIEDNKSFYAGWGNGSVEMYNNVVRRNGGYWSKLNPHPGPTTAPAEKGD